MPGAPGNVGELGIEEVLAVVEIEDGEVAGGVFVVLRGQVGGNDALFWDGKELRVEAPVLEGGFEIGFAAGVGLGGFDDGKSGTGAGGCGRFFYEVEGGGRQGMWLIRHGSVRFQN